jgi:hypothetical protein
MAHNDLGCVLGGLERTNKEIHNLLNDGLLIKDITRFQKERHKIDIMAQIALSFARFAVPNILTHILFEPVAVVLRQLLHPCEANRLLGIRSGHPEQRVHELATQRGQKLLKALLDSLVNEYDFLFKRLRPL